MIARGLAVQINIDNCALIPQRSKPGFMSSPSRGAGHFFSEIDGGVEGHASVRDDMQRLPAGLVGVLGPETVSSSRYQARPVDALPCGAPPQFSNSLEFHNDVTRVGYRSNRSVHRYLPKHIEPDCNRARRELFSKSPNLVSFFKPRGLSECANILSATAKRLSV
jgi:hypothetical protein